IDEWMGDRHRGRVGIDVDRRDVDLDVVAFPRLDVETRDARAIVERNRHPRRVLADAHRCLLAAGFEGDPLARRVECGLDRAFHRVPVSSRRSRELRLYNTVLEPDLVLLSADVLVLARLRRIEGKGALRPLEIWNTHAGQQGAVLEPLRRERDGDTNDRGPD